MLREAIPAAIVTRTAHIKSLDSALAEAHLTQIPVVDIAAVSHCSDATDPHVEPADSDLAYVIYTSGSSGAPKGAMIERWGMFNHLKAKLDLLELRSSDAVGQNASHCFDISVWQMLAPLAVGACVHIIQDRVACDARSLTRYVEERGVTVLEVVPSVLRAMLYYISSRKPGLIRFTNLRWLLSTGEPLTPDMCRYWLQHFPAIPLVNAYGPTECSDDVAHHVICAKPPPECRRIPIGRPIPGVDFYVLREGCNPLEQCESGEIGELYVGGAAVGRGYLNNPSSTAAAFVRDALGAKYPKRLYRTGDLVREIADGGYEYHGRIDRQIKIRGLRIELQEIEAVLCSHPSVRECAVVAFNADDGDESATTILVAYLVLDKPVRSEDISALAAEFLPACMIPATIVFLPSLPLTSNGKIDVAHLMRAR